MNVIKYREDENTFLALLKSLVLAKSDVTMKLSTGYLNLQKEIVREIVKADSPSKV